MSGKRPPKKSPLRHLLSFPLLRAGEESTALLPSAGEILYELAGENPENLLFGRLRPEEVGKRLRDAGIYEGLAGRGYPDPVLALECGDPEDQRIQLFAGRQSRDRLLVEVRLQIRVLRPGERIGPFPDDTVLRMLVIHWLVLSDPDRPFSIGRPRLPGQERPGLGILSECLSFLKEIGREISLDGLLDLPDHFHSALFYSPTFHFLDPNAEGRFLAMARDLAGIPLALASEAIQEGCLVDTATSLPVLWEPSEQVMPLRDPLRRHFRTPAYRSVRDEAKSGLRVAIDWDGYRTKIASAGKTGKYP